MRTKFLWWPLFLSLFASPGLASDFVVQIGAFRHGSPEFADAARKVGPVVHSKTASGITRVRVGPFASMADAESARAALRAAGYDDAFVLRAGGAVAARSTASLPAVAAQPTNPGPRNDSILDTLSDELRDRVVVLDGAYHVQEGGEFIPLRDYQRDYQRY